MIHPEMTRSWSETLDCKRIIDLILSSCALVALLPVLGIVAASVWLTMGRPIFFRQPRPGYRGRVFHILKFRTMSDAHDRDGRLLPDNNRLGRFGKFLRSTSLDELPELINVLTGEMSMVGPRPLLVEYLPRYTELQRRRHDVMPGITGWAQVNGRNSLSWEQKFELDNWYVEHRTFWLDCRILYLTVRSIVRRTGICADGHVTMPEFLGKQ